MIISQNLACFSDWSRACIQTLLGVTILLRAPLVPPTVNEPVRQLQPINQDSLASGEYEDMVLYHPFTLCFTQPIKAPTLLLHEPPPPPRQWKEQFLWKALQFQHSSDCFFG